MIVAAGLRPVLLGLIVGLGAGAPQVDHNIALRDP
jgi:hypothetical protein